MDILSRWSMYFSTELGAGLLMTLKTLVLAVAVTMVWGLLVAVARTASFRPLRLVATAYIEFFRGTPILVQLLVMFAAIPVLTRIFFPPFETAVIVLSLKEGSYLAEAYRSGFQAVPVGQREAAAALGMSGFVAFRRVVFPQAVRVILPAIGNSVVDILLMTPFVFLVGLEDFMERANLILSNTSDFSVYVFVTMVYASMGILLAWANSTLESKLKLPGQGRAR